MTLAKDLSEGGIWKAMKVASSDLETLQSEITISQHIGHACMRSGIQEPHFISADAFVDCYMLPKADPKKPFTVRLFMDIGQRLEPEQIKAEYRSRTDEGKRDFMLSLANSLKAVHDLGIAHRDLKFDNVMMKGQDPVLIDFGLAENGEAPISLVGGSPRWMAPELINATEEAVSSVAGKPTDIFSLGLLLGGCHNLEHLLYSSNKLDILSKVRDGMVDDSARFDEGSLKKLVATMIDRNPENRPTIETVIATLETMDAKYFSA